MKLSIEKKIGGAYARKEDYEYEGTKFKADIQNGDKVVIKSAGTEVTGQFGDQTVFVIETRNGDKNFPLNQSSINVLVEAFGEDTEKWVGKSVKVLTKKGVFAGKKGIAAYLVTDEYSLDDFGELTKATVSTGDEVPFESK